MCKAVKQMLPIFQFLYQIIRGFLGNQICSLVIFGI